jgi:hypothetical protein
MIGQMPAQQGGAMPLQRRQRRHCNKVEDASVMLVATWMQQGQQCQRNQQRHQHNAVNDDSGDFVEEGNFAKDDHFAMEGNFAKDGILAFTTEDDIAKGGQLCQGGQL